MAIEKKKFKTRVEKERDEPIMRSSSFFPCVGDNEARLIEEMLRAFVEMTNYFISELWFGVGLDDTNFDTHSCRNHKFYPYEELGIPMPETDFSGRLVVCCYHKARGEVNKRTKELRSIFWRIRNARADGDMERAAYWQRELAKKKQDRSPPLLSPDAPMALSAKMAVTIVASKEEREKEGKKKFTLDIGPIWNPKVSKQLSLENGVEKNHIYVSFDDHKHNRKLAAIGKKQGGINLSPNRVDFVYELPKPKKTTRVLIGAIDQGHAVTITFVVKIGGEYFIFQSGRNKQGKNAIDIANKIDKRKRGSKGRARSVKELEDYINWCCNELDRNFDLTQLSELRLEDLRSFGKGQNLHGFGNKFVPGKIREKLRQLCHQRGVILSNTPSWYKSRLCSACGFTHEDNRNTQAEFLCQQCGHEMNADVNAAINGTKDLYPIKGHLPHEVKENGFYWDEKGITPLKSETEDVK